MAGSVLDGKRFKDLFISGCNRLCESREYLDSINVFPVPDGDTGSNMADTLGNAVRALDGVEDHSLPNILAVLGQKLRMEAKGNSGIILSEFFHGMFLSFRDLDAIKPADLIRALDSGKTAAYSALAEPREGTILTVIRIASEKLSDSSADITDVHDAVERLVKSARSAVEHTPDQMELLRKNHVVDSGAHGFLLFWEGALAYLKGESIGEALKPVKRLFTTDTGAKVKYRYCVEALLRTDAPDKIALRETLATMGDSLIITGEGEFIKIHIHSDDYAKIFSLLERRGRLVKTKADDMLSQHAAIEQNKHRRVRVITDSTCDIDLHLREEYEIEMAPLQVIFGDETFRDRIDITPDEFYARLKTSGVTPRTSLPAAAEFFRGYEHISPYCDNILGIFISSHLSGTWQAGKKWGEEFAPGKVVAYDSGQVSLALGLMALEAAAMALDNASLPDILTRLDIVKSKMRTYFTVDTLEFLRRNGRIGAAQKIIGTLMGMKPILTLSDGVVQPMAKAFGRKSMMDKIIRQLERDADRPGFEGKYGVAWSDNPEARDELVERIKSRLDVKSMALGHLSPVIGAHSGPGAFGVVSY